MEPKGFLHAGIALYQLSHLPGHNLFGDDILGVESRADWRGAAIEAGDSSQSQARDAELGLRGSKGMNQHVDWRYE